MGADGGTIPNRRELVKIKEKTKSNISFTVNSLVCSLSREPLAPPVVADCTGKLYNKESVLLYLLDKESFPDTNTELKALNIASLKDFTLLRLTPNPSVEMLKSQSKAIIQHEFVSNPADYICPVSLKEMNGKIRFVFLKCGCVVAESVVEETLTNREKIICTVCGKECILDEITVINSSKEEREIYLKRRSLRTREARKKKTIK